MIKKKNFPLIIGFSIPLLMILFVAASIYLPGLFLQPKFNFLYSTDTDYYGSQTYSVNNSHLVYIPQPTPTYRPYPSPQLYVHNVTTNESTPISFQEAQNLNLNPTAESPDGFKLENGNQGDGFFPFFWYNRDYTTEYLAGHNVSKKLNIKTNGTSYYSSIHFLGWVMK
ncbi:MAG TPA: hypothetical protein VLF89_01720 [Candidatus Saccharimonadales bacterium]|nr:hypothetical protein [Candidatus Saccharimonadales bacterium]